MFCWQCEQTLNRGGCRRLGICGKTGKVSSLMDLLTACLKRLALAAQASREGRPAREADRLLVRGLAATMTGVNFDPESLSNIIDDVLAASARLISELGGSWPGPELLVPSSISAREAKGAELPLGSFPELDSTLTPQLVSMRESALYALKGAAGYAWQAWAFGREDEEVYEVLENVLAMSLDSGRDLGDWLEAFVGVGRASLRAIEMLDEARTSTFGHPKPTRVSLGVKRGKAVLVSGHSLKDLALILKEAVERGVSVYSHGELLSAHSYHALGALAGHYGTSWPNQDDEIKRFPGPAVFAGGCLRRPSPSYRGRVYCSDGVTWPEVARIEADSDGQKDFGPVIEAALKAPGFEFGQRGPFVAGGWARKTLLDNAGSIADLILSGAVKGIILAGGRDGTKAFRAYYRRLVELSPADSLVLTMGCGRSRFLDLSLGDIDGVPRLLDLGQCGDVYSAIALFSALAKILETPVENLPIHVFLSWHEQKALAVLTALMGLGLRSIRLGPTLPAFFHRDVMGLLAETYGLRPVATPEADLADVFGGGLRMGASTEYEDWGGGKIGRPFGGGPRSGGPALPGRPRSGGLRRAPKGY